MLERDCQFLVIDFTCTDALRVRGLTRKDAAKSRSGIPLLLRTALAIESAEKRRDSWFLCIDYETNQRVRSADNRRLNGRLSLSCLSDPRRRERLDHCRQDVRQTGGSAAILVLCGGCRRRAAHFGRGNVGQFERFGRPESLQPNRASLKGPSDDHREAGRCHPQHVTPQADRQPLHRPEDTTRPPRHIFRRDARGPQDRVPARSLVMSRSAFFRSRGDVVDAVFFRMAWNPG